MRTMIVWVLRTSCVTVLAAEKWSRPFALFSVVARLLDKNSREPYLTC